MFKNFFELEKKLERIGIDSHLYSFDGYKEDAICVEQDGVNNKWLVFHACVGRKGNLKSYVKEKDAIVDFLMRMRELKILTKNSDISLPLLVKDLDPRDSTSHFIDVVALKNNGKLCQWSPHEQSYFYKVDDELIVDAEKVVRCEHCKHKGVSGIGSFFCIHPEGLKKVGKDTYCCHGEES